MITTAELVAELMKFPNGTKVTITGDPFLRVGNDGAIHIPTKGKARRTNMGENEGWADDVFTTAGGRIQRWLREHHSEALEIAFAAIAGLYLYRDEEDALPEDESYPRGSGSEYVDDVGAALWNSGIMPLIEELQSEAEED